MNDVAIKNTIKAMQPDLEKLVRATGTDINKFMNNAIMAAAKPELQSGDVDRASIYKVVARAAQDGVLLDDKEAAMVIGWNRKTRQKEAQYRLMAAGVMSMIARSPDISRVVCQLVHKNDDFSMDFVTDGVPINHNFSGIKGARGEVVGAYAVAKLADGSWTSPEYMEVDDINSVRDAYVPKDKEGNYSGMWSNSWGEAARKTVLHRAKKRWPISQQVSESLVDDDVVELNNEHESIIMEDIDVPI